MKEKNQDSKSKKQLKELAEEREYFLRLGMEHFAEAYGEDEPDYSDLEVKEKNPKFKPGSKI